METVLMTRSLIVALIVLAALVVAPRSAFAHRPAGGDGAGVIEIPDPTTSYAFYEQLERGERVDLYRVDGRAGVAFHAGINIPQVEGLEQYGVTLALIGPGLPAPDPEVAAELVQITGIAPDQIEGAVIVESRVTSDFFEPFTQTNYWGRQSLDVTLPEDGSYRLAVWNPTGESGRYVLDTGREEVFGPLDLFRFPLWWIEVHHYFGHTPYIVATLATLFLIVGSVWWWRRTRPAGRDSLERPLGGAI